MFVPVVSAVNVFLAGLLSTAYLVLGLELRRRVVLPYRVVDLTMLTVVEPLATVMGLLLLWNLFLGVQFVLAILTLVLGSTRRIVAILPWANALAPLE